MQYLGEIDSSKCIDQKVVNQQPELPIKKLEKEQQIEP